MTDRRRPSSILLLVTHSVRPIVSGALVDIRMHSASATGRVWSDQALVDSPRLVIQRRGFLVLSQASRQFVGTPATVLAIDRTAPYRLRRLGAPNVDSIVVVPKRDSVVTGAQSLPLPRWLALVKWIEATASGHGADFSLAIEEQCAAMIHDGNITDLGRSTVTPSVQRSVRTAYEFVVANAQRQIPLAEIGQAAGVSPFHLAREFKRVTGVTLHQTQLRLRVVEALHRLDGGQNDLTSLALDLGFSNHAHFTKVFRESVGIPPRVYRDLSTKQRRSQHHPHLE